MDIPSDFDWRINGIYNTQGKIPVTDLHIKSIQMGLKMHWQYLNMYVYSWWKWSSSLLLYKQSRCLIFNFQHHISKLRIFTLYLSKISLQYCAIKALRAVVSCLHLVQYSHMFCLRHKLLIEFFYINNYSQPPACLTHYSIWTSDSVALRWNLHWWFNWTGEQSERLR